MPDALTSQAWTAPFPDRLGNDRGTALVMSLLFLVLLVVLAPVAMRMTASDVDRAQDFKDLKTAFYIAEAGLEHAKSLVKASNYDDLLAGPDGSVATATDNGLFTITGSTTATIGSGKYTAASFNGGTYNIRFYDNNDGDGSLYNDKDDLANIEAVGLTAQGKRKTLRALVRKKNINADSFPAAVTMVGPSAQISAQGSGFEVDGTGHTTTGAADPDCASQHGIATEASAANTTEDLDGNAENKIDGVGGNHDIANGQTTYTYAKALDFYNDVKPLATDLGVTSLSGGQTLGTVANPQISYVSGNLSITGSVSGVGVLIVDGDLDITGNLNFQGVILIGVCSTCTGVLAGTGSAEIYGAMVVGNQLDASAMFTGSADIFYSCEALNNAAGSLKSTFATVSWNEVG
ncbi:MAG: hypothetical protein HY579_07940 [Nitrospinae bacterium]|nr:hypothetical protein [Nitrospinota bacterium]